MSKTSQAWLGELVVTFIFVTIAGAALIVASSQLADFGLVGVALANGLAMAALITTFGPVSGAHMNPVVTLSAWIGRKISGPNALGYVASQVLGALAAALLLRLFFAESQWAPSSLGSPSLGVTSGRGFAIEAVATFFFVMVIWGTGIDERSARLGGIPIGFALTGLILTFGPLTGASMNPARYLGPAAVGGNLDEWWVYLVGPAAGATLAGLVYPAVFSGPWPWARVGGSPDLAPDTATPAAADQAQEQGSST